MSEPQKDRPVTVDTGEHIPGSTVASADTGSSFNSNTRESTQTNQFRASGNKGNATSTTSRFGSSRDSSDSYAMIQKLADESLRGIKTYGKNRNSPAKKHRPLGGPVRNAVDSVKTNPLMNKNLQSNTDEEPNNESDAESVASTESYVGIRRSFMPNAKTEPSIQTSRVLTGPLSSLDIPRTPSRARTEQFRVKKSPIRSHRTRRPDNIKLPHETKHNLRDDALINEIDTMIAEARSNTMPVKPRATMTLPSYGIANLESSSSSFSSTDIPSAIRKPPTHKLDEMRNKLKDSKLNIFGTASIRNVPSYGTSVLPNTSNRGSTTPLTNDTRTHSYRNPLTQGLAPSPVFSSEEINPVVGNGFKIASGLVRPPSANNHTPLNINRSRPLFTVNGLQHSGRQPARHESNTQPLKQNLQQGNGASPSSSNLTSEEHLAHPSSSANPVVQQPINQRNVRRGASIRTTSSSSNITPPMPVGDDNPKASDPPRRSAVAKWPASNWKTFISAFKVGLNESKISESDLNSVLMNVRNNLPDEMRNMTFDEVARRLDTWQQNMFRAGPNT